MEVYINSHVTIQRRSDVPVPVHKEGKLFYCPFCNEAQFKPARKDKVEEHLDGHYNRAVILKGLTVHRCGLGCEKKLHYHCPYCPGVIFKRSDFLNHLQSCKQKPPSAPETTPPLPPSAPPPCSPAAPSPLQYLIITNVTPPLATGTPPPAADVKKTTAAPAAKVKAAAPRRKKKAQPKPAAQKRCPFCDKNLCTKFNLNRHIERKHTKEKNSRGHLNGEIIDRENGIYAIVDVLQRHGVPVHVQLKSWGTNHHLLCENSECQMSMDVRHLCRHIRSATYTTSSAKAELLSPHVLDEMVAAKWFGRGEKEDCLKRQELANNSNAPLSVHTIGKPDSQKFISVYEPAVSNSSGIERVMVVYDTKTNTWTCPCANPARSCVHKDVAKWHLFQTQRILFGPARSAEEVVTENAEEDERDGKEDGCAANTPEMLPEDVGHPLPHGEPHMDLSGPGDTEGGAPDDSQQEEQAKCYLCVLRQAEIKRLLDENRALRRELDEYRTSEGFLGDND